MKSAPRTAGERCEQDTDLVCSARSARCRVDDVSAHGEARLALVVLRSERERTSTTVECKQLAVGNLAATIRTAATGEGNDGVAGGAARVEVEAGLCQRADNESGVGLVVVQTLGL